MWRILPELLRRIFFVEQVVDRRKSWGFTSIREVEWTQKDVRFALPAELTN
jgi:hypothetical protein